MEYGLTKPVAMAYDDAISKVTAELKKEGFGVLTTIDVRETLKSKIGVEFPKYVILGACNPPFAHKALLAEAGIGLLLPCNVIVREEEGKTIVGIFDPMVITKMTQNPALRELAVEIKSRLQRVFDTM